MLVSKKDIIDYIDDLDDAIGLVNKELELFIEAVGALSLTDQSYLKILQRHPIYELALHTSGATFVSLQDLLGDFKAGVENEISEEEGDDEDDEDDEEAEVEVEVGDLEAEDEDEEFPEEAIPPKNPLSETLLISDDIEIKLSSVKDN